MTNGKVITGIAAGVLVALLLIPKTRKMISNGLCSLTGSIRDFANSAEDVADSANDVADTVRSARKVIS